MVISILQYFATPEDKNKAEMDWQDWQKGLTAWEARDRHSAFG